MIKKKCADGGEPVIVIPIIVEVVQVEVPLRVVPVEVRDVPVAIHQAGRTVKMCDISSVSLPREYSHWAV